MSHQILILDDEKDFLSALCDMLEANQFVVQGFSEVQEALNAVQEGQYSLIISDYSMPVMNGAEFLAQVRRYNLEIPIIFLSAFMGVPEMLQVAQRGVTSILEKPVDSRMLIKEVEKFVTPEKKGPLEGDLKMPVLRPLSLRDVYTKTKEYLGEGLSLSGQMWSFLLIQPWQNTQELETCLQVLREKPSIIFPQLSLHLQRAGIKILHKESEGLDLGKALFKEYETIREKVVEDKVFFTDNKEVILQLLESMFLCGEGKFNLRQLRP